MRDQSVRGRVVAVDCDMGDSTVYSLRGAEKRKWKRAKGNGKEIEERDGYGVN